MASLSNGASAMAAMLPVGVGMQDVSMGQAPPLAAQQPLAPPASLSVTPTVATSVASSQQVDVTTNATANALVGESPLSVISVSSRTLKKKKPGRSPSQIWLLLTDEPNPQRRNAAACKHCKQQVLYYKKSEQAVRHLKKCSVFQSNQHQYGFIAQFQDILPLYQQKITQKTSSKKRQKAAAAQAAANAVAAVNAAVNSAGVNMNVLGDHHQAAAAAAAAAAHHHANVMNSLAMQQGMADNLMDASVMQSLGAGVPVANVGVGGAGATSGRDDTNKDKTTLPKERKTKSGGGALTKVQQERFEDALAMHAYVTGMAFDAMEETHLQRALLILKSNAKLPDKKRFESDLLLRCYDKMYKRVWGYLTASSTRVCIKRDAWSTMNLYNTNNPEDVYVTYMAVNSEKRFFLESEKVSDDAQYNSILIAQDIKRVMAPIVSSVSGVVTGSTQFHARAWEMLKAEYPTKFFYGCITHALHLAIMDIFGPEKSLENDPRRMTPQLPMDFPFQDLVDFTNNCNELISFFSSYQYAPKFKMFDAQTLQTMKSFSNASPTMQWGTLAARFRVLLQSEDIIQSIVSDPDFIVSAPVNQRSTRQNMKDVVMSLNWKITLEKAINILQPIELILYKFQDDKAPISEVYFESKHLLTDFDAVFGLSPVELEYIKKVVTERWQYVLGEAHALAFLLDPRYIGKSMTREYREHIEELIFKFPETDADIYVNEERKRAISAEYTDYVIYAKNQRANETFKWEMLDKGTRTPLQFWQAEADEWPHLKQLALTLFSLSPSSVASEKSLCKASLVQSSRRNKLSFDDMRRLAFITINDTQFTNNRMGDFQNTLPDFSMGDPGLSEDGMMMWMI